MFESLDLHVRGANTHNAFVWSRKKKIIKPDHADCPCNDGNSITSAQNHRGFFFFKFVFHSLTKAKDDSIM